MLSTLVTSDQIRDAVSDVALESGHLVGARSQSADQIDVAIDVSAQVVVVLPAEEIGDGYLQGNRGHRDERNDGLGIHSLDIIDAAGRAEIALSAGPRYRGARHIGHRVGPPSGITSSPVTSKPKRW
jgi:hypothetical protein